MPYFFGIKTPLTNIEDLAKALQELERCYIPIEVAVPDALHVTVLYVGRRAPKNDVIYKISGELTKIGKIIFKITNKVELYPSTAKPRALVLKIDDRYGKLREARRILINILKQYNIPIEDRFIHDFNPHITLGRIRSKLTYRDAIEILENVSINIPEMTVEASYVELIDSTGGSYKVISRISTLPQTQDQDTL